MRKARWDDLKATAKRADHWLYRYTVEPCGLKPGIYRVGDHGRLTAQPSTGRIDRLKDHIVVFLGGGAAVLSQRHCDEIELEVMAKKMVIVP